MGEFLTGTVVAEKYRLDSLLRSGEVGDFYRGRHLFMDKPVTLKVLPSSLAINESIRAQFTAEARSASALTSPHILVANDFGSNVDGSFYVVYEGFDGEPLKNTIGVGGQFSIERAAAIARQIAEALNTAHANGFIHGNLTPDSILVANSPDAATVKVFDFEPVSDGFHSHSDNRSPIGVAYLAPENFSGLRNVDGRSDIYSLGIILYQMLAGELPFKGETPTDVMLKHAEEEPPALSEHRNDEPGALEAVIRKALAKDPDDRFQTAAEFVEELEKAIMAATDTGAKFWKTAAAVIVGIGLLASLLIYATSSKQTVPLTQLQPDAEGQPVQPINPATGAEEQTLASGPASIPGSMSDTDIIAQPPGTLPGGDNYNPWATGAPPPGAPPPTYVPPGGQVYTIDPSTGSPFMPNDSGVILVPVPANTNTHAKPSPTPKTPAANANTQTAPPANTTVKPQTDKGTPATTDTAKPSGPGGTKPSATPKRRGNKPRSPQEEGPGQIEERL
jgi:serine/threonine protein kinase